MEIRHIMHTARSATIEIADGGRYFTKQPVELRVNGEPSLTTEKTITSLFSLKPDQKYVVEAYVNGEKQGEVSFKTDYEYVTLDVTRFGAKGDGEHDDTHFIQAAIMACPVNSRVYFPAGIYRITSLFLKSHIRIELAEGARPNVGSAVIRLTRYEEPPVQVKDEKKMFALIRASFNQRRKTLVNGLGNAGLPGITKESAAAALAQMGLSPTVRGEALTLEQFARLSDLL